MLEFGSRTLVPGKGLVVRVLFVVPYPPSRIRVRSYNLVRQLTALGHEVTVLTLWSDAAERADAAALARQVHHVVALRLPRWRSLWNCLQALPTRKPLQAVYCWQPALARQAADLAISADGQPAFDVVHVEHLRGAEYGLYLQARLAAGQRPLPVVWDSVDCISYLFRQAATSSHSRFGAWAARLDLARTERYEGWLAGRFAHVSIVSAIDRQALLGLLPPGEKQPAVSLLPNGVELDYFCPDPATGREPASVVFSGKMSYHANVTMALYLAQEIMPRVWRQRPDVQLTIVGKAPPPEVRVLGQRPGVAVTGLVEDIRPYLRRATAAVVPLLYGAGLQFKVLEGMACATPVVATPQAAASLAAVPGRDLLVAGSAEEFAGAILALLADPQRQQAIGAAGRAYVESHHNWATITGRLAEIYQQVVHQAHS